MIEIKNVFFEKILNNISFRVKESEFLAIIGHNGSGKTTLIRHLNGLLLPSKGSIEVDSLLTKGNEWEIRKRVGVVFQNPEDQLIQSIVEEDVAFGLENLGVEQKTMKKRVENILKTLGIVHLKDKSVNALSFGQKQLVALAGVLVMEPKYIVLDEPFSSLDPKNKKKLIHILERLHKEGKTIILVTNNLRDVKIAQSVLVLKNGNVLFHGKKSGLSTSLLKGAELDE